jgi:hypothetical protein
VIKAKFRALCTISPKRRRNDESLAGFLQSTGNTRKLAQAVYDSLTKNVLDTAVGEAVI